MVCFANPLLRLSRILSSGVSVGVCKANSHRPSRRAPQQRPDGEADDGRGQAEGRGTGVAPEHGVCPGKMKKTQYEANGKG